MTDAEFANAMIGIYAYDTGSVDSGIHDELLRARVIAELRRDGGEVRLSRLVRDHFLSEEALAKHYGIEDVSHFIRWLDDQMGYCLRLGRVTFTGPCRSNRFVDIDAYCVKLAGHEGNHSWRHPSGPCPWWHF